MSRLDCATTNNGSDDWSFLMLGKVAPVIQASSSTFPRVHPGISTRKAEFKEARKPEGQNLACAIGGSL